MPVIVGVAQLSHREEAEAQLDLIANKVPERT